LIAQPFTYTKYKLVNGWGNNSFISFTFTYLFVKFDQFQ